MTSNMDIDHSHDGTYPVAAGITTPTFVLPYNNSNINNFSNSLPLSHSSDSSYNNYNNSNFPLTLPLTSLPNTHTFPSNTPDTLDVARIVDNSNLDSIGSLLNHRAPPWHPSSNHSNMEVENGSNASTAIAIERLSDTIEHTNVDRLSSKKRLRPTEDKKSSTPIAPYWNTDFTHLIPDSPTDLRKRFKGRILAMSSTQGSNLILPSSTAIDTDSVLGRNILHYILPPRLKALTQCTPCDFSLRRRGNHKKSSGTLKPTRQNPTRLAKSKANNTILGYSRAPPHGAYRLPSMVDISGVQVSIAPSNYPDAGRGAFLTSGLAEDGSVPPGTILTEYGGVHFTSPEDIQVRGIPVISL